MAARRRTERVKKRRRPLLVALVAVLVVILAVGLACGCYLGYLELSYTRIEDGVSLENEGATPRTTELSPGVTYTALSYNIGFGANSPGFSCMTETGAMADGTPTQGEMLEAQSEDDVGMCIAGAMAVALTADSGSPADFMLFQEVDVDSARSCHVDQRDLIEDAFPSYGAWYAENLHTGYLVGPVAEFRGATRGGLLTLGIASGEAIRRSYPANEEFPERYAEVDRCFSVLRVPTGDDHELVLVNSHMSAYGENGQIRARQLELLCQLMADEYAKGNYVIAGGDWNHALCGSLHAYPCAQRVPNWIASFDESRLPAGFEVVRPENVEDVASCRASDIPYEEGVTYRVTTDGFIVSANVRATATILDTRFAFSDHNPVLLAFELGA